MRSSPRLFTSKSSKLWLARQFRDSYVKQRMASPAQYRSRSAFKLLEMDAKYKFLERRRPSHFSHPRIIVDLGAAPGGWSQVVALKMGYAEVVKGRDPLQPLKEPFDATNYGLKPSVKIKNQGTWSDVVAEDHILFHSSDPTPLAPPVKIIALDLNRMHPIRGVISIQADFLSPMAAELIRSHFPKDAPKYGVDIILSDMAANVTGNPDVDARNSLEICMAVLKFAHQHLSVKRGSEPGGVLVWVQFLSLCDIFSGDTQDDRLKHFTHPDMHEFRKVHLHSFFRRVIYAKPPSSRSESSEGYFICIDWLGHRTPLSARLSRNPKEKSHSETNLAFE